MKKTYFLLLFLTGAKAIITVTVEQNLSFGTFSTGSSGGTVTISKQGSRTKTGSINLISMSQGNKAILKVNTDTTYIINVAISNVTNLSNAGHSIGVSIDQYDHSFIPSLGDNYVNIGGTLSLGPPASNPPGNYNGGSFLATFTYE